MGLSGGAHAPPLGLVWLGGPSPPSRLAGVLQPTGMKTPDFIEGKRLLLPGSAQRRCQPSRDTAFKGCSTGRNCVGVLFPLSAGSPGRLGLGLSVPSRGSGKLQPHPLRRHHEHLQMWFALNAPR